MYTDISQCRVCGGSELSQRVHIDDMLPAGLYTDEPKDIRIPLTVCQCQTCSHVQLRQSISPELYKDYLYTSDVSAGLMSYLGGLATDLIEQFDIHDRDILEIGSSDGTFLRLFAADNRVIGIEPSSGLAETAVSEFGIDTINGFFGPDTDLPPQDVLLCRHVLEHIDHIDEFLQTCLAHSKPGGILLIEVPSLELMVEQRIYSNFFHEHLNYFSEATLAALLKCYGFDVEQVYHNDIHGGSMGLVARNSGVRDTRWSDQQPDQIAFFDAMREYVSAAADGFAGQQQLLGYGAAHRTSFLISVFRLQQAIDYVVDKNPNYHGKYVGGSSIQIRSPALLEQQQGRDILLFALSYEDEILKENLRTAGRNRFISLRSTPPAPIDVMDRLSRRVRRHIVTMNARANASHSGSALSIVDILTVLYFRLLNIDPAEPDMPGRDRFILSKGHASAALYATLAERGFFDPARLDGFYCDQGTLPGHLDREAAPGIEVSAGSLGHGLALGIGIAIANGLDGNPGRMLVLCGDGELNEGAVWEAIMFAPTLASLRLTLIIDYNKLQGYGRTNEIIDLEPLADKFRAFNWRVSEIDGHDHQAIEQALGIDEPGAHVVIAHTIKGKGVSYMEDQFVWHYKSPNDEQLQQALRELR